MLPAAVNNFETQLPKLGNLYLRVSTSVCNEDKGTILAIRIVEYSELTDDSS